MKTQLPPDQNDAHDLNTDPDGWRDQLDRLEAEAEHAHHLLELAEELTQKHPGSAVGHFAKAVGHFGAFEKEEATKALLAMPRTISKREIECLVACSPRQFRSFFKNHEAAVYVGRYGAEAPDERQKEAAA